LQDDTGNSCSPTDDGNFVIVGSTESYGNGRSDIWVLKIDPVGNLIWSRTYGESHSEGGSDIQQTRDGGYIISGRGKYNLLKIDCDGEL